MLPVLVPLLRPEQKLLLTDKQACLMTRMSAEGCVAVPGFVEGDLVGQKGGNSLGEFGFALTVSDLPTVWTVHRSARNKAHPLGSGGSRAHRRGVFVPVSSSRHPSCPHGRGESTYPDVSK